MTSEAALTITPDHPALDGHFPGNPILPGVAILAEVLAAIEHQGRTVAGCTVKVAKFHSPARPGDTLRIALDERPGAIGFEVSAGERRIANGTVALAPSCP
jgi:3-hydroxymyristoyl/3-hydroxydecanoyl-(acyl carrier protein) dehydratase